MRKQKVVVWVLCAGVIVFWMVIYAWFGITYRIVKLGLAVVLLAALGVLTAYEKINVAILTRRPPTKPGQAHEALLRFGKGGRRYWIIAFVREGNKGFVEQLDLGEFADEEHAQRKADELNAQAGLGKWEAGRIFNRWCRRTPEIPAGD